MNHLTEETLSALLDGEVDREEAGTAEAHLGECAECRSALDGMRRTAHLLGRLERLASPDHLADEVAERVRRRTVIDAADRWHVSFPIPKPRPFWMSAAASVILMVVLVYVVAQMKTWKPLGEVAEPREEVALAEPHEGEGDPRAEETLSGEGVGDGMPAPRKSAKHATPGRSEEPLQRGEKAHSKKGKGERPAAQPAAGRLDEDPEPAPAAGAEVRLAREDRAAVGEQEREKEEAPAPSADVFSAASRPAEPAMMEVGETRVRLVRDGEALGELRILLGGVQAGGGARGIRILCDPDGGARYGSEANPVQPERGPEGFVWPRLEKAPEVFHVGADKADGTAGDMTRDAEMKRAMQPAGPAPVPPPIAFSLEGKLVVDREGRARFSGIPPWLAGPLSEVSFQAGRCGGGEAAAVEVPFEAEWTPAD